MHRRFFPVNGTSKNQGYWFDRKGSRYILTTILEYECWVNTRDRKAYYVCFEAKPLTGSTGGLLIRVYLSDKVTKEPNGSRRSELTETTVEAGKHALFYGKSEDTIVEDSAAPNKLGLGFDRERETTTFTPAGRYVNDLDVSARRQVLRALKPRMVSSPMSLSDLERESGVPLPHMKRTNVLMELEQDGHIRQDGTKGYTITSRGLAELDSIEAGLDNPGKPEYGF